MTKPTLILTVGLPRSGKSTHLRDMVDPIATVCPDEVRKHLGCFPFTPHMEPLVWFNARMMVECLFASGAPTVILDATNCTRRRRDEWRSDKWTLEFWKFTTLKDVCIERAKAGGQDYLVPVIERMARDYERPTEAEGHSIVMWS